MRDQAEFWFLLGFGLMMIFAILVVAKGWL